MAKKNLKITLYVSELLYDIQNMTYLTGKSRQTGQNHEEVANMQASDDDEHKSQLLRSISSSFDTLKTKLSEYLAGTATTANDILLDDSSSKKLELSLLMPENYNASTADTISAQSHQYIVNMSVADWFNITNKADASDYVSKAAVNLETIREAINKRVRPTRTVPSE